MNNLRRIPCSRTRPFSRSGKSILYGYSSKVRSGKLPNKFIGQLSALEKSLVRVQGLSGESELHHVRVQRLFREPKTTLYPYNATFRTGKTPCTRTRPLSRSRKRPCTRTRSFRTPGNSRMSVQSEFSAPGNWCCTDIPDFPKRDRGLVRVQGSFRTVESSSIFLKPTSGRGKITT
jgi:hypothetical protein